MDRDTLIYAETDTHYGHIRIERIVSLHGYLAHDLTGYRVRAVGWGGAERFYTVRTMDLGRILFAADRMVAA